MSWFCALRGKKPTRKEKSAALYLGAITPLWDDLNDSLKYTGEMILNEMDHAGETSSDDILMVKYLYNKWLNVSSKEMYNTYKKVVIAQDASANQFTNNKLDEEELLKITRAKGASATLIYRMVLDNPLKQGEEEAISTLGFILQLINDMFDVYKDYREKQQTLFTNSTNLDKIYQVFESTCNVMINQFLDLEYNDANIKKCLAEIFTVISRGYVCFNQLLLCRQSTGGTFKIEQYERSRLICDMEKFSNIKKMIRYSIFALGQYEMAKEKSNHKMEE